MRHKATYIAVAAVMLAAVALAAASQCLGRTQKGARCRNKTNNPSGYCYLHEGQIPLGTNSAARAADR